MAAQTLAARLAKYAAGLTFDKLTPEAVHETKRRVIDSFATAVGAMPAEAYHIARKCALRVSGSPGVSVLGGGRSSDGQYARLNAHGFYWTASEHNPAAARFYNFARGSLALYRQPDGEKERAFSVRCVRE